MEPGRNNFWNRTQAALPAFISLLASWTLLLVLIRLFEWLWNGSAHGFPASPVSFLGWALLADIFFICPAACWLLVIFLLFNIISVKLAKACFLVFAILLTLGYFALLQYFNSTTVLLGADLYGYSWQDIQQTVSAGGGLNWKIASMLTILVVLIVTVFYLIKKRIRIGARQAFIAVLALVAAGVLCAVINKPKPSFERDYDNDLAVNKMDYFLQASYLYLFPQPHEVDIYSDAYIGDYGDTGSETLAFHYPDENNYPFLHTERPADVLSPFFKSASGKPNIVMIVVEGLGRAFSNEGAYLGSFTPYLDSLSQHSLYWENFLSGGGRTFAVLPTLLGSLPFEKNGFNETRDKMPPHLSLMSILKRNGYETSFLYAGDASFDNMDVFMQKQSVDFIQDRKTFPSRFSQMPSVNGFSWGYGDKELYRYMLEHLPADKPSLRVVLTVATHSPFRINEQTHYEQAAKQRMMELQLSVVQQQEHQKYLAEYATIVYADDALRNLMEGYRKLPDYENTIFLITGDHRMPEIPMASRIDRFHVPLLIYSPLLQRTGRFRSLSTHFDVTPSLLAYLRNYGVSSPSVASWIGGGLDTARNFRNIHTAPLMRTKTDLMDFIMGEYHLNGMDLYRLNPSLGEEKVTDPAMRDKLQAAFDRFRQKNEQLQHSGKLIPDSLVKLYYP